MAVVTMSEQSPESATATTTEIQVLVWRHGSNSSNYVDSKATFVNYRDVQANSGNYGDRVSHLVFLDQYRNPIRIPRARAHTRAHTHIHHDVD